MKIAIALLAGLLLVAATPTARAITPMVYQMDSFMLSADAFMEGAPAFDFAMLTFAKFDSSLGTLDEVVVTLMSSWDLHTDFGVVATVPSGPFFGDMDSFLDLTFSGPAVMDFAHGMAHASAFGPDAAFEMFAPGMGMDFGFFGFATSIFPTDSDAYVGPGDFDFFLDLFTVIPGAIAMGADVGPTHAHGMWAGDVTVEYFYTPIPEPSRALLGLVGIAAIGLRRRR